jgi:abortive infection bacteriophage resistance protein
MHAHHGIVIDDKKQAVEILRRVPYNLLIYPGLKIWYSSSPTGNKFMQGTTIEELYELYKFDSFMKGKILEVVRSFENMFLGSLAYHFEYEYQEAANKRELSQKKKS